jgi:hypothetical protein
MKIFIHMLLLAFGGYVVAAELEYKGWKISADHIVQNRGTIVKATGNVTAIFDYKGVQLVYEADTLENKNGLVILKGWVKQKASNYSGATYGNKDTRFEMKWNLDDLKIIGESSNYRPKGWPDSRKTK